jgi:hypothetical protein
MNQQPVATTQPNKTALRAARYRALARRMQSLSDSEVRGIAFWMLGYGHQRSDTLDVFEAALDDLDYRIELRAAKS